MTKKMLASAVALTAVAILAGCGKTETPEIILDSGANAEITTGTVEEIVIGAASGDTETTNAVVQQPSEVVEANSGVAIYTGEDVQAAMDAANAALAAQQEALKNAGVDAAAVQAAQEAALKHADVDATTIQGAVKATK
jgi:lipoprotein